MDRNYISIALLFVAFSPLVHAQPEDDLSAPMTYSVIRSGEAAANSRALAAPVREDWSKIQEKGRSFFDIQERARSVAINLQSTGSGATEPIQFLVETTNRASSSLLNATKHALDANDVANEAISAAGIISQYLSNTYAGAAYREQMMIPGITHLVRSREAEKTLAATQQKRMAVLKNARALNDEMRKIQLAHRKLVADYQTAEKQGKSTAAQAAELDLTADRVANIGSKAASAYSEAAQLAAVELKLARVIVESQTLLSNEAVIKVEKLIKKP